MSRSWSSSWMSLLALLLAACSGRVAPWSEAPAVALDLRIELSAEQVVLLQPVTVTLDLYRRAEIEVEFAPAVVAADFLAETVVLPEVEFGVGRWQRTVMTLRPVRGPGELLLPAFVARAKDGTVAATTKEHRLQVISSLGEHGAELEAPAEPFPAPPPLLWIAGGAALALFLLLGLWFFVRRRNARPLPLETALPPHTKALRALARLRTAPRTTTGEVETFYVEVSAVLRLYLEERFGLRAPERTTEEFLRELESHAALASGHRRELTQFLSQCDLVKFAAVVPTENDHLAVFALAEAFVERTRPDRAAERPDDGSAAEASA